MLGFSSLPAKFRRSLAPLRPFSGSAGGSCPLSQQFSPRQVQIGQPDQRKHLRSVLLRPVVAHLGGTKLALDHPGSMPDTGPNRGALMICALGGRELVLARALERHAPVHARLAGGVLEAVIHIALIAENRPIILAQKARRFAHNPARSSASPTPCAPGRCSRRPRDRSSFRSTTGCLSCSGASPDPACRWRSWSRAAHE